MAGLSGWDFLQCRDPFERLIKQAIGQKTHDLMLQRDEDLAIKIVNKLGESFKT